MEYDRGGSGGSGAPLLVAAPPKDERRRKNREGGGGGGRGGRGGRGGQSWQRRERRGGFDPHASFTPKILTKPAVVPADGAELSQPSPQPPPVFSPSTQSTTQAQATATGERTLFVPSPSSSSAPPSLYKRERDQAARVSPSGHAPPSRTSSPAVGVAPPVPVIPPLTAPSSPLKLLSASFRLSNLDQLQPLLYDHAQFTVIAAIGLGGSGKSSLLNSLILRPPLYNGFPIGEGRTAHTTSGVDVVASPERVLYVDSQPLMSSSVVAGLLKEDGSAYSSSSSPFAAQVAADMFDVQMPLMMLSLAHILLITVTWPIPASFIAHLRTVFTLHAQLASTLAPHSSSCEVVLLINKAQENADDSPLCTHSPLSLQLAVDALFADCAFKKGGKVGNGGGGGEGHVNLFVLPWRERGSLYDSSMREMRAQVLGMRREGGGKGGEKEWGRRLAAVHGVLVHSAVLREQRKVVERRVALVHPPPVASAAAPFASSHGYGHGPRDRRSGLPTYAAVKEAGDSSYHRDAPTTSHHKLYTPP